MNEEFKTVVYTKEMTEFEATLQYIYCLMLHTESTRVDFCPSEFLNNLLEENIRVVPNYPREKLP